MADLWEKEPLVLDKESEAFYQQATGLTGSDLRKHLEEVQSNALRICPYRCLAKWNFLDWRTASLPAYDVALALAKTRRGAIWLDVGCCTGTDVRKAAEDGWPIEQIIGTDIESAFLQIGRQLFREPADATLPAFIAGDLFSDDLLDPATGPASSALPPLHELKTLKPLAGWVSVINAGSLFHLFDEATQVKLARRVLSLLSTEKGSMIIGGQVGAEEGGDYTGPSRMRPDSERQIYSPSKWIALWHSIDAALDCQADLQDWKGIGDRKRLVWSVKRR